MSDAIPVSTILVVSRRVGWGKWRWGVTFPTHIWCRLSRDLNPCPFNHRLVSSNLCSTTPPLRVTIIKMEKLQFLQRSVWMSLLKDEWAKANFKLTNGWKVEKTINTHKTSWILSKSIFFKPKRKKLKFGKKKLNGAPTAKISRKSAEKNIKSWN